MPNYDPATTTTDLARHYVQRYAPLLGHTRLPAYRQPELRWVITPNCHPDFVQRMKATWTRLDLTDRTQWQEDEARFLRAHRFYGSRALWKKGLTVQDFHMDVDTASLNFRGFQSALADLIGEKLLTLLGPHEVTQWFPYHYCQVGSDPSGHSWRLHCDSLLSHVTADGRPLYYAATRPQLTVRGAPHTVAFTPHAIRRLGERVAWSPTTYADLGDVFGIVRDCTHVTTVHLYPHQLALVLYGDCVPGFVSDRYPDEILDVRQPHTPYRYRLGYCPLVQDGDFWVATTLLPPGYKGTPEYTVLLKTALPPTLKDRMLHQCDDFTYHRICTTMDFSLLKWFHQHGVPQVLPTPGAVHEGAPTPPGRS